MIRTALLAAASAMALGLAACNDDAARIDAPEPAPLAELTAEAADLPFAEPARVEVSAPDEGYRWAERAYGLQRAVYDTPPDYGFAYHDVEPMVWETEDDWSLYAEPWDGGYRYYYYEPGAAYPYFVRDSEYGYAYDAAGVLIALFDGGGRYLPRETVYRYAPTAGRYYVRGRDLRNAGLQARRLQVSDETWRVQAPRVQRGADPWLRAAREAQGWRAWRERDRDRELARFEAEGRRRTAVQQAWREREQRISSVQARDRREDRREAAQAERWRDRMEVRDRREALAGRQRDQEQQARAERRSAQQAAQAQARQQRQQQVRAEERRDAQQAQAEQQRQRQVQAQQRQQQARGEARRQQQEAQQQARSEQRRQAQQAQAERRREQQAARQQQARQAQQQAQAAERRQQQVAQRQARQAERAQARTAESQGRPAAARERERGGEGRGRERGADRKD